MKAKFTLTQQQIEALDFLVLNKCEIIHHPKGDNTFECHEIILNRKIAIWIKPDGIMFATGKPSHNYI